MCGIVGAAWTTEGARIDREILKRMTDVIRHRGPDDEGFYFSDEQHMGSGPQAALGHRRLSIIDLETGHQPLSNEDGTVWIVFNGEIYNYRELRPDLEARGHRFATHSDTEVIVHLYEEYGPDCVDHLRGMFAFGLWDERQKRLFLARDRLGQKPLFYRWDSDRLSFSSELKSLLQIPGAPRELDFEALELYLAYQYVPDPKCILKGYAKLPPAHRAVWSHGRLQVERYWHPPFSDREPHRFADQSLAGCADWSTEQWQRHLRRTLTEAVRLRMRSDVPLGAFLSGGIDSTIIAGLMQSLSERPVLTFSIGFPIKEFDETAYAREAAQHLGTDHHEYRVEPSAIELLPKIIWQYDEPFSDSSAIPTMYLSEVTRKEVTVALSGDGGDELFAGYDRYQAVRLASRIDHLPQAVRSVFGWPVWQRLPEWGGIRSLPRRAKRFAAALSQPPQLRYLRWVGVFDQEARRRLYTDDFRSLLDGFDAGDMLLNAYQACPDRDFITQTTCTDLLTYLPFAILKKVDIASMTYGLEARSPFLDHHVAELAARMPMSLKQRGTRGKVILIDTFRDLLPPSIQTRGKMGFGVPLEPWFRHELKDLLVDSLLGETAAGRGYFNIEEIRRLVDEHVSGQVPHTYRLWNLLCFEHWCRTYLDPTTVAGP